MDARVKIESLPDGTQQLTIQKATQADIGEYRCEASNELGAAWTEAPVTVKCTPILPFAFPKCS